MLLGDVYKFLPVIVVTAVSRLRHGKSLTVLVVIVPHQLTTRSHRLETLATY